MRDDGIMAIDGENGGNKAPDIFLSPHLIGIRDRDPELVKLFEHSSQFGFSRPTSQPGQ